MTQLVMDNHNIVPTRTRLRNQLDALASRQVQKRNIVARVTYDADNVVLACGEADVTWMSPLARPSQRPGTRRADSCRTVCLPVAVDLVVVVRRLDADC